MTLNVKFEILILMAWSWRWMLSWMSCHAVLQKFTNALEEHAASISRAEDGESMSFWNISKHWTTQHHIPKGSSLHVIQFYLIIFVQFHQISHLNATRITLFLCCTGLTSTHVPVDCWTKRNLKIQQSFTVCANKRISPAELS
jgi:sensor histidine kinase YesM